MEGPGIVRFVSFGNVKYLWKSMFLWRLYNRKIQSAVDLNSRGWKGSTLCSLCREHKTIDQIYFHCILAKYIWWCWNQVFGMKFCPRSVETLYDDWMAPNVQLSHSFRMYITAGFVWSMRCNRNKMAIEKKIRAAQKWSCTVSFLICRGGNWCSSQRTRWTWRRCWIPWIIGCKSLVVEAA